MTIRYCSRHFNGFLIVCLAFFPQFSLGLELPKELNASDRSDMIKILGMSTSSKLLSSPHALGGDSGVELGVAMEMVSIEDLNALGSQVENSESEFRYPRFSLAKGLFYDLDLHLHFVPFNHSSRVSQYGGLLKWMLYDSPSFPMNLSVAIHADSINVSDAFTCKSIGAMAIFGFTIDAMSLYFGGGQVISRGVFLSGAGGDAIVAPSDRDVNSGFNTLSQSETALHSFVGLNLNAKIFFVAFQLDRYRDSVYSAKVGFRL